MNTHPIKTRAFHSSPFRFLFFARLLTVVGNGIAPIALAFAVLDMGGSASELGIVVAARSLFNVAFLLLGGVLADRYSRSRVMVISSIIAAASQALVAGIVLADSATVATLALLGMLNGAASGIALPASSALVPQTVAPRNLREANAFIQLAIYGGTVLGASLGGLLVSAVGPGWGLAIDALGFAASAPLYFLIQVNTSETRSPAHTIFQDLREGWREFADRSWVWSVVLQFTVIGVVMILGPVIADGSFGRALWGVIIAAQSVGLMVGSFLALRWRPRRDLFIGVMLAAFCAVPTFLLSQNIAAPLLMTAFFIAGVTFGLFGVAWSHALQTHIPEEKLARVYAWDAMGSFVAIPFGELIAGPAAAHFGSGAVLAASDAAILIASLGASLIPATRTLNNAPQVQSVNTGGRGQ